MESDQRQLAPFDGREKHLMRVHIYICTFYTQLALAPCTEKRQATAG